MKIPPFSAEKEGESASFTVCFFFCSAF